MGSLARSENVSRMHDEATWDVVVIGGGATGLGTAVDAAARGYRTLLLEAHDFAQGTSSRSTKLIHGGVRYPRAGQRSPGSRGPSERGILFRNAPHLVHERDFIVPAYGYLELPYYGMGLKVYDLALRTIRPQEIALARPRRCDQLDPDDPQPGPAWRRRSTLTASSTTHGWRSHWRARWPTLVAPHSITRRSPASSKNDGRVAGVCGPRCGDRRSN